MPIKNKIIGILILATLTSSLFNAQTQITINQSMIENVNSDTPVNIADEQDLGTDPETAWESSWSGSYPYPHYAIIDLGSEISISQISIFDIQGEGNLILEKEVSNTWVEIVTDPLSNYMTWNNHSVSLSTQRIRITKSDANTMIGEIKLYGTSNIEVPELSDLQVDGVTISGFSPSITDYTVLVSSGSTTPLVTATPSNTSSNIVVTETSTIPGTTVIEVTSEDGNETMIYNVNFIIDASYDTSFEVTIHFDSPPTNISIDKAILKYNKDFAYSFTMDDGTSSQFDIAYPILSGQGAEDGCFYTDGCGNDIAFESGIAINASTIDNSDKLSWDEIETLTLNGWDVMSHSYTHAAYTAGIDYNNEVTENISAIKDQIDYDITQFVIPSGDEAYITPAFNNGMTTVYNQGFTDNWSLTHTIQVDDAVITDQYKHVRKWVGDSDFNNSLIDNAANLSVDGNHYWYNDFGHSIDETGGDFPTNEFSTYMHYVDDTYGKNGTDRVWMASLQEVNEYILLRENVILNTSISGDDLIITININENLDYLHDKALTLIVNSDNDFDSIEAEYQVSNTFNGTGSKKIINLDWSGNPLTPPVNTADINQTSNLQIFPNPAKDIIRIESGNMVRQIIVFNQFAQEVINIDTESNILSIAELSSGLYFIKVLDENGNVSTSKIIKE